MRFEHATVIPASRDKLWDVLMDIPTVAACFPGIEEVREISPEQFVLVQKVRVGPIRLVFEGNVTIAERDKEAGRAMMELVGADKGVGGFVKATLSLRIDSRGPAASEMRVTADANVMGRLGEFGEPVMRKKADSMMQEFMRNLIDRIRSAGSG